MHSGASGLNFFVTFSAHALAGAAGGWLAASLGYPALLWASAAMCAVAALLFRMLLSTRTGHWRTGFHSENKEPRVGTPESTQLR
jgi:hypothetical protein